MEIACPSGLKGARLFITGGAGFLATNLIEVLVNDCEIVALDNLRRNSSAYAPWRGHRHFDLVCGDVLDEEAVRICSLGADYILHMAAIAGVNVVVNNPATTLKTNLIGTMNVLEVARKHCLGVRRVVDFSTSEVYGPHVYRAREDGLTSQGPVYEPRWNYAVSKLASEFLAHSYYTEYGVPTCAIRPFNVFGPYQLGEGAIRNFVAWALAGDPLVVHGNGDQVRSWCYVDDMTRAILAVLTRDEAVGHHFNVGNPRATTSTLELARMVIRLTGGESPVVSRAIAYRDVEVRVPSVAFAKERLGWEPQVDLEDGIQRTIDWWRGV